MDCGMVYVLFPQESIYGMWLSHIGQVYQH